MVLRPDPYRAFRFQVEIDGLEQGGFQSVSGLERESKIEPYHEGGVNYYEHQLITQTSYPPLVLKRGLVDQQLWDWHHNVIEGWVERKTISIVLFDDVGDEAWRWVCVQAFPSKLSVSELDAMADNVATESIEFVHHGLSRQ